MQRMKLLALALLVSCGSSAMPAAPAPTSPSSPATMTEICDLFGNTQVMNGEYIIQNNAWNTPGPQCLATGAGTSFRVTKADHNKPLAGPPAAYPSIYKGCHWGSCTQRSGLPIRVDKLQRATSDWNTVQPDAGAYNVSYDIWLNTTPQASGNPDGAELMIWIARRGALPAGSRIASATISGMRWEVWTTRMDNWNYITYLLAGGNTSSVANLDIKAFIQDAVSRGSVRPDWYLIGVEAGFEIWQGGVGLATNSFAFNAF